MKKLVVFVAVGIDALILFGEVADHRPYKFALVMLGIGLTGMFLVLGNSGRQS